MKDDIILFCRLLNLEPTHGQLHWLLRVQNHEEQTRIGLVHMSPDDAFTITAVATLFRAFVHKVPSYVFYEDIKHANKWIESTR